MRRNCISLTIPFKALDNNIENAKTCLNGNNRKKNSDLNEREHTRRNCISLTTPFKTLENNVKNAKTNDLMVAVIFYHLFLYIYIYIYI